MAAIRTPPLTEVIRLALDARLGDVHVALPARVDAYDATKQSVDVVPLLYGVKIGPDGSSTPVALPKQVNVPVLFPGGGGFRATFPIAAGDFVLLVVADRSLDAWKASGNLTDPKTGAHSLPDAVAIPGLHSFAQPLATAPTDRATFGSDTGDRIEVLPARVNLGAGASQALVLGGQYQSHMTSLQTALSNLSTALNALGAAITPLMLPPAAAAAKAAAALAVTAATAAQTAAGNLAADISSNSFTT